MCCAFTYNLWRHRWLPTVKNMSIYANNNNDQLTVCTATHNPHIHMPLTTKCHFYKKKCTISQPYPPFFWP